MEKLKEIPDKILHCIARIIQDEMSGTNVKCLYCKYAVECAKKFKETEKIFFIDILHELESLTSIDIFLHQENLSIDILKGSWAEKYPDVLEELTNRSFDEQQDILRQSDILQYLDNQHCKQ